MQHFAPVASVTPVWRSSSLQRTSTNELPVTGSHVNGAHEHSVLSPRATAAIVPKHLSIHAAPTREGAAFSVTTRF